MLGTPALALARDAGQWRGAEGLGWRTDAGRPALHTRHPQSPLTSASPDAPGSALRGLTSVSTAAGSVSAPAADMCATDPLHLQSVLYAAAAGLQDTSGSAHFGGAVLSFPTAPAQAHRTQASFTSFEKATSVPTSANGATHLTARLRTTTLWSSKNPALKLVAAPTLGLPRACPEQGRGPGL